MRLFFLFVAVAGMMVGAAAPARAQSGALTTTHGTISWGGYTEVPSRSTRKQKVPTFSEANHGMDEQVGWFTLRLAGGAVSQGELANLVYEPFSAADAKMFDASRLPTGPDPRLSTGTEMKRPVTRLSLRAARRNPQTGQPERLVSFDYQYVPDGKNAAARSTGFHTYASHSVLQNGDWYKMGVGESGIYKLDKAALADLGLNTQTLNPRNLHIYGNAMGILPQASSVRRPDDLAENNVLLVNDNGDGVLDNNEFFLFYSPGPHTWEAQGGVFRHRNNIYTDTAYYFVTVNNTPGRRVAPAPTPAAGATPANITTFTYRDFLEHDLVNLLHSGRTWVGEGFRPNGTNQFSFSGIPDLVANAPVKVTSSLVASSFSPSSFRLTLNGATLGTETLRELSTQSFTAIARQAVTTWQLALPNPGTDLNVGLTYSSGDGSATAYLDYLEINAQRQLRLSDAQLEFRSLNNIGPNALNQYMLSNSTGAVVWDVTNPRRPASYTLTGGSFLAPADTLREFVAFLPNGNLTKKPRKFGRVPNQDLHAYTSADLIIVTYPTFLGQAQRLADHRRTHDNLQTVVVTTPQIYNEYGSGGQDVTAIRDFVKQIYDRSPAGKQMELLLFGDASYDYKSDPYNPEKTEAVWPAWWRNRVPFRNDADFDKFNQNYVPTYESRESFGPFYDGVSYASDDFYVLLDDDEGEWPEGNSGELLDMGVGRLPVRMPKGQLTDVTQAREVVDKIISYDSPQSYGKWRNRITLVSDDGEGDLFVGAGSEIVATSLQRNYPVYNVHKVYLDLYPQVALSAGQRSPNCERAINQAVEQGSLIVNYLGHGGPKGWADEQILTDASVSVLHNPNNLTFFTTGTCDFSYFDNPDFTSGGEKALTDNATGGAIGLFTTTRVVDAGKNATLNQAYFNRVLQPINGKMPSIGAIVMMSKNDHHGSVATYDLNDRNYTLLADPSMTLAYPEQTVVLDSVRQRVRGQWQQADTLQALARVRVHGKVLNGGALNTNFTGQAQVTIYDKPATVMTLGDEINGPLGAADGPKPIVVQESVIYSGQANVVNGMFNLSFVVPKDINYNVGLGKASLYAYDPTRRVDANGYQLHRVGGANSLAPADDTPPEIRLFMDDESFAFGGLTAPNTTLLAFLTDDNGINTTGAGIGHDITATIDNDVNKQLVLNDSYVSNLGDYRSGKVTNLFKGLANGPHSLRLKAWDTYNNSAEKEIEFVVATNEKIALDHVLNYPNPFANSTTFMFDHNQAGGGDGMLDVQVQIFTVAGRLVRTLTATLPSSKAHQDGITWNGRDDFNDQLARGVYVYRLSVRSANNGTASKFEKLVILN
ncbi:type IX secretion system sortase PorU [Hymenobacter properus]|uniref:Type IX secretion system sortase PorU n=1 Tax=Hymenobacter properus TaxID=2791026 RepID=A0A931FKC6_9BACT|nr:type IX secretion system sortase PorU [Hymenobacter properus]MBF9143817.1 type IX secretion system sortase PorU [Hymenobacter properus]MBR7722630.1 type IX secretion system sortase PorU [Microvirga sp. SRT04]